MYTVHMHGKKMKCMVTIIHKNEDMSDIVVH